MLVQMAPHCARRAASRSSRTCSTFEQEHLANTVYGFFFREGSVGFDVREARIGQEILHFSESVEMRLEIHRFALQNLVLFLQFVQSGGELRLSLLFIAVPGTQRKHAAFRHRRDGDETVVRVVFVFARNRVYSEH